MMHSYKYSKNDLQEEEFRSSGEESTDPEPDDDTDTEEVNSIRMYVCRNTEDLVSLKRYFVKSALYYFSKIVTFTKFLPKTCWTKIL